LPTYKGSEDAGNAKDELAIAHLGSEGDVLLGAFDLLFGSHGVFANVMVECSRKE